MISLLNVRKVRSPILAVLINVILVPLHGMAAEANAGSEPDPSLQVERDWVDSRWNRTDVGPFLASNLEIAGHRITKGLSIKVGENAEGTVCYDTQDGTFRGAWLGGFLRHDPARFGLIGLPRIAGEVMLTAHTGTPSGSTNRYTGLHLQGKRVALEFTMDGVRVLESPWLEQNGQLNVFTRSIELAPTPKALTFVVASLERDSARSRVARQPFGNTTATFRSGTNEIFIGLKGASAELEVREGAVLLRLTASEEARRFKLLLASAPAERAKEFDELFRKSTAPAESSRLAEPGPAQWLPELKTVGQRGLDSNFLAVDTLTVPYENPWKALMFFAGVDFTPDGAAYVCSIHGDVWRVTGADESLRELRWKRYATGLFQPLGLKVRDGKVYVLGRDQITRLHDLNGDGEADFYENFCNLIETMPGHNYVTCLEQDATGNFYYVDTRGVHRVSPDGRRKETLASGFRNPNGLGVSLDGSIITVAPQQGDWTPSSVLCEIRSGSFHGYGGPKIIPDRPLGYDPPLCWIPHRVDNSSGSQVWVPSNLWGPLGNQMLHLLWGRCGMMLVLRDVVAGVAQGAVVPLPARFVSGPNRGTFNARDGHLYIAGSTGWQTSAVKEGALQRVRLTGRPVILPIAWRAHLNGIAITFTQPLDRAEAEDPGSYSIHQWNYRYAAQYGSKDWSVVAPDKEGRDEIPLGSVKVSPDGKTVFLEMPNLAPVMQMEIKFNLHTADGKPASNQLWLTLNRLDSALR